MASATLLMPKRFARARELAGLSVGQAARLLGVSAADLAAVEQRGEPRGEITLARLVDLYGCSVAWITGEVPQFDYAAADRAGGRELYFRDREAIAELLASMQRRTG